MAAIRPLRSPSATFSSGVPSRRVRGSQARTSRTWSRSCPSVRSRTSTRATVGPRADVTTVQGVSDRTVLVTGGTGGLGAAVTRAFLEEGWRVVVPWVAERELRAPPFGGSGVQEHERLELVQADL